MLNVYVKNWNRFFPSCSIISNRVRVSVVARAHSAQYQERLFDIWPRRSRVSDAPLPDLTRVLARTILFSIYEFDVVLLASESADLVNYV